MEKYEGALTEFLGISDTHDFQFIEEKNVMDIPNIPLPVKKKLWFHMEQTKVSEITFLKKWGRKKEEILVDSDTLFGSGIGGSVFKGKYAGVDIAVKEYSNLAGALKEGEIFSKIPHHPSICHFYGICTDGTNRKPCLLIELIEGVSGDKIMLENALKNQGIEKIRNDLIANPINFLNFLISFASAVNHLHLNNIYHADLAARNIMITRDGKFKLTDFGLAHCSSQSNENYQLHTLNVVPTKWSAPEGFQKCY
jgi:serine/threonine protein kinase